MDFFVTKRVTFISTVQVHKQVGDSSQQVHVAPFYKSRPNRMNIVKTNCGKWRGLDVATFLINDESLMLYL